MLCEGRVARPALNLLPLFEGTVDEIFFLRRQESHFVLGCLLMNYFTFHLLTFLKANLRQ